MELILKMNMAIEAYTFISILIQIYAFYHYNPLYRSPRCRLPNQNLLTRLSRRRRPNLRFFPLARLSRPTVTLFHHDHLRDVETPFHLDTAFGHTPLRIVLRPGFADFAGDD
jgi:hypothetical protein